MMLIAEISFKLKDTIPPPSDDVYSCLAFEQPASAQPKVSSMRFLKLPKLAKTFLIYPVV